MHILLTDALTCPRCGPAFGLVVLADRLEERRVAAGHLGCPNCRSQYPVRDYVADLRPGPAGADEGEEASTDVDDGDDGDDGDEAAVRLAALMGLAGAGGMVLVAGPGTRHAPALHALVPEVEVIAVSASASASAAAAGGAGAGVSPLLVSGPGLPVRGGLRAAALTGGAGEEGLREGLRVLAPGARLVVDPAGADAAERLRALGAEVLLDQDGVVVARAPGRPVELRYNAVR